MIRIDKYVSLHDAGRILNPALFDGQVHGGFAMAIGSALYERFVYAEDGSFLTGSFADYAVTSLFTASGFNVVGGAAQPKSILEVIRFNGDGTLTVPAATVSINGVIGRSPPGGTGSYMVEPDCTGSLQFGTAVSPGPKYDLFVAFKGSEIQMIQTGPGSPVFQGTAERVSR